ncbi:hypothetical protein LEMLEM_LOCUS2654, partial [Lemmus lemmus]
GILQDVNSGLHEGPLRISLLIKPLVPTKPLLTYNKLEFAGQRKEAWNSLGNRNSMSKENHLKR